MTFFGSLYHLLYVSIFLQVLLTKFPSLPPSFQETPNAVQELTIASNITHKATFLFLLLFS